MSKFIKVGCEYAFGGQFGSSNEEVFVVPDNMTEEMIRYNVRAHLAYTTGFSDHELANGWYWEFITVEALV